MAEHQLVAGVVHVRAMCRVVCSPGHSRTVFAVFLAYGSMFAVLKRRMLLHLVVVHRLAGGLGMLMGAALLHPVVVHPFASGFMMLVRHRLLQLVVVRYLRVWGVLGKHMLLVLVVPHGLAMVSMVVWTRWCLFARLLSNLVIVLLVFVLAVFVH